MVGLFVWISLMYPLFLLAAYNRLGMVVAVLLLIGIDGIIQWIQAKLR